VRGKSSTRARPATPPNRVTGSAGWSQPKYDARPSRFPDQLPVYLITHAHPDTAGLLRTRYRHLSYFRDREHAQSHARRGVVKLKLGIGRRRRRAEGRPERHPGHKSLCRGGGAFNQTAMNYTRGKSSQPPAPMDDNHRTRRRTQRRR